MSNLFDNYMFGDSHKKLLLMKISVSVLALGLFLLWSFNLKNIWNLSSQTAKNSNDTSAWEVLRNDVSRTMAMARGQFNQISDTQEEASANQGQDFLLDVLATARQTVASTTGTTSIEIIPVIISPPIVNIPPPATPIKNINCPDWINCMPTVVGTNDNMSSICQVPVGCEGITQIAY
ncbi:hypothetical protein GW920_02675 [Candidatus Falkowbacteria bacterium]|uniref:Uncharacterized protein n=1 Tax=Candidatus Falkowbacteria bacterium CG10_big_fil_rev_8_21_14_0_10_37_18 TaxID=1974562 RepID=A0A2H0V875_9BACT|nr:hypothetical protein [Candidatus Falkowbacteria bacterium]NCQ12628.1 hypothetical protein [Candidatus Falkowbacteria bacterium]PIR95306.1 MAG: hypothetical protein COT93_03090 [Candidatus Falkowbacteria bacterium CG10_big_fil_rev_8_21_14_0_10_37_18]